METLLFYVDYYVASFIALCGFDGSDGSDTLGWIVVAIALITVIWAFYVGIARAIWPGETDTSHIKYHILTDEDSNRAH
jgi:hypothetical protein|tara:strand:+ start:90 stop:326 length:237 start_codon:yes stop_codon:yes gene_type:complete